MTTDEIKRLAALKKKGAKTTPEEKAELETLLAKASAVEELEKAKARIEELLAKGDELTDEERDELEQLQTDVASVEGSQEEASKTVTFDTTGATHVVTMRNEKAVKVWFRDGKEIGVEDVA